MSVGQVGSVHWDLRATPYEFQVHLSLLLRKCFKHLPEPLDQVLILAAFPIIGDIFENLRFNFTTAGSLLNIIPVQEGQNVDINDLLNTFFEPIHLQIGFAEARLYSQLNEFLVIFMCHSLICSIGAKLNRLLVGKNSCKCVLNSLVKLIWFVLISVFLKVSKGCQCELIEAFKIFNSDWISNQLLPEDRSEMPVHGRACS